MADNRIHSLDSIRGMASLIVVIFHCLISFPVFYASFYYQPYDNSTVTVLRDTPLHIFWAGPEAVLLFFVLSGFVLSLPYLKSEGLPYGKYLIKRIFRIYVPYIVIMLGTALIVTLLKDFRHIDALSKTFNERWVHPVTLKAVISYVFMIGYDMTNVNGVVWSLNHEMRISIIFPLIMLLVNRCNWFKSLVIGIGLSLLGCAFFRYTAGHFEQGMLSTFVNTLADTSYYCTFFVFGAALAKYRKGICDFVRKLWPVCKLLLWAVALLLINFKWSFKDIYAATAEKFSNVRYGILGDWMVALGVLLLFVIVLSSPKAEWLLSRKPFVWLGRISYSVYLVHLVVIMLSARYLSRVLPLTASLLLVPVLTLPIAFLSYKLIELPAMNLGARLARGRNVKRATE